METGVQEADVEWRVAQAQDLVPTRQQVRHEVRVEKALQEEQRVEPSTILMAHVSFS